MRGVEGWQGQCDLDSSNRQVLEAGNSARLLHRSGLYWKPLLSSWDSITLWRHRCLFFLFFFNAFTSPVLPANTAQTQRLYINSPLKRVLAPRVATDLRHIKGKRDTLQEGKHVPPTSACPRTRYAEFQTLNHSRWLGSPYLTPTPHQSYPPECSQSSPDQMAAYQLH